MKDRRSVKRIREDARQPDISELHELVRRYKPAYAEGGMQDPPGLRGIPLARTPLGPTKIKGAARKVQAAVMAAATLPFAELMRIRRDTGSFEPGVGTVHDIAGKLDQTIDEAMDSLVVDPVRTGPIGPEGQVS